MKPWGFNLATVQNSDLTMKNKGWTNKSCVLHGYVWKWWVFCDSANLRSDNDDKPQDLAMLMVHTFVTGGFLWFHPPALDRPTRHGMYSIVVLVNNNA
jgi:hypothetical protein